jgi:hypothetical protein
VEQTYLKPIFQRKRRQKQVNHSTAPIFKDLSNPFKKFCPSCEIPGLFEALASRNMPMANICLSELQKASIVVHEHQQIKVLINIILNTVHKVVIKLHFICTELGTKTRVSLFMYSIQRAISAIVIGLLVL